MTFQISAHGTMAVWGHAREIVAEIDRRPGHWATIGDAVDVALMMDPARAHDGDEAYRADLLTAVTAILAGATGPATEAEADAEVAS